MANLVTNPAKIQLCCSISSKITGKNTRYTRYNHCILVSCCLFSHWIMEKPLHPKKSKQLLGILWIHRMGRGAQIGMVTCLWMFHMGNGSDVVAGV